MRIRFLIALGICVAIAAPSARPSVPTTVNIQGRLTTPTGAPLPNGMAPPVTFSLYDAPSGGSLLWTENLNTITVSKGLFAATLDFSSGFTDANTLDSVLQTVPYLEIAVGADVPMTPRIPFTSTPYSLRSNTADLALSVPDGSITGAKIAAGTITTSNLASPLQETVGLTSTTIFPSIVGATNVNGISSAVSLAGNYAYLSVEGTLQVVDVSNPAAPFVSGAVYAGSGGFASSVAAVGTTVCLTISNKNLLQVYDVSNPSSPQMVGSIATGAVPTCVAMSGTTAYVVNKTANTLQVFDVSTPSAPVLRSNFAIGSGSAPVAVTVDGTTAYVASGGGNLLQVIDVSNRDFPHMLGISATDAGPVAVAARGNVAYVANQAGQTVEVFDVSNPASITVKSRIGMEYPTGVAVLGTTLYVTDLNTYRLFAYDVSHPAAPELLGSAVGTCAPECVAAAGDYTYAGGLAGDDLDVFYNNALAVGSSLRVAGGGYFGGDLTVGGALTAPSATIPRLYGPMSVEETVGVGALGSGALVNIDAAANDGLRVANSLSTPWAIRIANQLAPHEIGMYQTNTGLLTITNNISAPAYAQLQNNGAWTTVSDRRAKTDIRPLTGLLAKTLGLRPVSYYLKNQDRTADPNREIGFVAQDVERLFPSLVSKGTGLESLNYSGLSVAAIGAVQELNVKEENHERQVAADLKRKENEITGLRRQNAMLLTRLERLERNAARQAHH